MRFGATAWPTWGQTQAARTALVTFSNCNCCNNPPTQPELPMTARVRIRKMAARETPREEHPRTVGTQQMRRLPTQLPLMDSCVTPGPDSQSNRYHFTCDNGVRSGGKARDRVRRCYFDSCGADPIACSANRCNRLGHGLGRWNNATGKCRIGLSSRFPRFRERRPLVAGARRLQPASEVPVPPPVTFC
jgi:hypothetical protein